VVVIERTPDWARQAALDAFDRREPDVAVADLQLDSLMTRAELTSGARILRFASVDRYITVVVMAHGQTVSLTVTISPPAPVPVDVRPLHGALQKVRCSPEGEASCSGVPTGPLSLLVHWPSEAGGAVSTAWVLV